MSQRMPRRRLRPCREEWDLGADPIANMIDVLEHHFVHVIEIEAGEKFDGISAVVRDQEQRFARRGSRHSPRHSW